MNKIFAVDLKLLSSVSKSLELLCGERIDDVVSQKKKKRGRTEIEMPLKLRGKEGTFFLLIWPFSCGCQLFHISFAITINQTKNKGPHVFCAYFFCSATYWGKKDLQDNIAACVWDAGMQVLSLQSSILLFSHPRYLKLGLCYFIPESQVSHCVLCDVLTLLVMFNFMTGFCV